MKKSNVFAVLTMALLVVGLMVGPAAATTTTVNGQLVFDQTTVPNGGTVNFSVLGLTANGVVDLYGNQSGANITAVVTSQLGKVNGGATTPPGAGSWFASSVKYVSLTQGVAKCSVTYPAGVSGTDEISVTLQESFANEQGGITYQTIKTFPAQAITVSAASSTATWLKITNATVPATDPNGAVTTTSGVDATITAGYAGTQFEVDSNAGAAGQVTLSIYKAGSSTAAYTFTGTMSAGKAYVTLDNSVVKAGSYLVKAELAGFSGNSVQYTTTDTLTVVALATPSKVALSSMKSVISNDGQGSATVTATLEDQYGNAINATGGPAYTVDFTDANAVVNDGMMSAAIAAGANSGTATIDKTDILKTGTTSLVATVANNTAIAASDPLAVKIVANGLVAQRTVAGPYAAGALMDFNVAIDGNTTTPAAADGNYSDPGAAAPTDTYLSTTAATSMVVQHIVNGASVESITVNVAASKTTLEALFKKASGTVTTEGYLIGDAKGAYGQYYLPVTTAGGDIVPGNPASVSYTNASGDVLTSVPNTAGVVTLYGSQLAMSDAYGNAVTSGQTGTATVTSANGVVAAGTGTFGPNATVGDTETVTYPSSFTGSDTITIGYTKPGLTATSLTTTISSAAALATITPSISNTTIPENATVPLLVEAMDQNGDLYTDPTGITMTISGDVTPTITDLKNTNYGSGMQLVWDSTGRQVLEITAGSQSGTFTLTFANATGTVTATKTFTISAAAATQIGTSAGQVSATVSADQSVELDVNTTNTAGATPAQTWFVFTATHNGQNLGLFLLKSDGTIVPVSSLSTPADFAGAQYTFGSGSTTTIGTLTMADLGLTSGDTLTYAYAYSTSDVTGVVIENVVTVTVQ